MFFINKTGFNDTCLILGLLMNSIITTLELQNCNKNIMIKAFSRIIPLKYDFKTLMPRVIGNFHQELGRLQINNLMP